MRQNATSLSRQYTPHSLRHHNNVGSKKRSHDPFFLWPLRMGKRVMDKAGIIFFTIVADTSKVLDDCCSAGEIDSDRHANALMEIDGKESKFGAE